MSLRRRTLAVALQARPQLAAEAARGAGQQEALESVMASEAVEAGLTGDANRLPTSSLSYTMRKRGHRLSIAPSSGFPSTDDSARRHRHRRPRNLAHDLVDSLGDRIRDGRLRPAQAADRAPFMAEFGVSRTVVREAISKLQAAGLVETRHGIGTFVVGPGDGSTFRIGREQLATLHDVVAMLELRIGVEVEAAGSPPSAARRRPGAMRGRSTRSRKRSRRPRRSERRLPVSSRDHAGDPQPHFTNLMLTLGTMMIPRARLDPRRRGRRARSGYLRRVNAEHESIYDAIANRDAEARPRRVRTHLANSRSGADAPAPRSRPMSLSRFGCLASRRPSHTMPDKKPRRASGLLRRRAAVRAALRRRRLSDTFLRARSRSSCRSRPAAAPTPARESSRSGWRRSGASRSSSRTRAAPPARSAPTSSPRPSPTATRS
jgi:DNA-binding FadR family transcriptional regulator